MRTFVDSLTRWDTVFMTTIFSLEGKRFLSKVMPWISHSGNGYYYPLIPVLLFFFEPQTAKWFLMSALVAFGIELPAYKILKNVIRRDRPCVRMSSVHSRVSPSDQFSFPSGHTAAAIIVATLLTYFVPPILPFAFGWAVWVGLSRIYLGVHYPSDILAGTFLGMICAAIGLVLVI